MDQLRRRQTRARRLPIDISNMILALEVKVNPHAIRTYVNPNAPTSGAEPFAYKSVVRRIRLLNWENLNGEELQMVMYLSWVAAVEFAEALRLAQALYPEHHGLQQMAHGELKTKNLQLDDFTAAGDHHEFLRHFLLKHGIIEMLEPRLGPHAAVYLDACRALRPEIRAMTVFSREEELSGIFVGMLDAKDWSAPGLDAFNHYLSRHIAFDSSQGGHHDLISNFEVDENVLPFYEARLETFRLVSSLWSNDQPKSGS